MQLSRARELFLADLRAHNKARATLAAYASDLTRFVAFLPMNSVLQFTDENVSTYFNNISSMGLKPSTLHRKMAAISQFAKWGQRRGLWSQDPMRLMDRIAKPKRVPRPFSDDEVIALVALDLQPREYLIRSLLLYTGLRVTPLCEIKLGDISYAPPLLRATVKGGKTQVVKLHPRLAELIKAYALAHTDLKGQTFLLASSRGARPHRRDIERMTARWGVRAGVPDCLPHRFRHTFATKLLRTTQNVRLVQQALGHEDIATTMLYTLVTNEAEAEGIGRLDWGEK